MDNDGFAQNMFLGVPPRAGLAGPGRARFQLPIWLSAMRAETLSVYRCMRQTVSVTFGVKPSQHGETLHASLLSAQ
jgi:hypothetical protein